MTPDSVLFRHVFDIRSQFEIRNCVKGIKPITINSIVRDLSHFTGVKQIQHLTEDKQSHSRMRTEIMTRHGLRKFFDTTCTNGGMNPLYIEILMGHKTGLKGSYFKPTMDEILEGNDRMNGYASVINDLTVNEENRLRKQVSQMKAEADSVIALSDRLRSIEMAIKNMLENRSISDRNSLAKELIHAGIFKPKHESVVV